MGRDPVAPDSNLMKANIENKVVMVTGAGGSIGSELCRQIIMQRPKQIVLFELSEFALYQVDRELTALTEAENLEVGIVPLLGSVQKNKSFSEYNESLWCSNGLPCCCLQACSSCGV